MHKYWDYVLDRRGNIVPSASIQVNKHSDGSAAVIYSDDGITVRNNPVVANTSGYFEFYAADDRYDLVITKTGLQLQNLSDIEIVGTVSLSNTVKSLVSGAALPDRTASSVPTGLAAVAASSSQINLSWNASTDPVISGEVNSGVKNYKVYANGVFLKAVTTTSTTDTGLLASTAHTYTVSSVDNAGNESAQSAPVSATTLSVADTTPPSPNPITTLAASAASSVQINLTWSASTDAGSGLKGYNLYRSTDGGATYPLYKNTTTLGPSAVSYNDSGLTPSTTYKYKISAVDNSNNENTLSAAVTQATSAAPPLGTPIVLYTDITSGPLTGGLNNKGCFLGIFGVGFGAGVLGVDIKVYINNVEVGAYIGTNPVTSLGRSDIQQITVQPGALGLANGTAGRIRVNVSGVDSNIDKTFTPNPGTIYFVDNVNGNDANAGTLAAPLLSVRNSNGTSGAYFKAQPGDFIVMRGNGTVYQTVDATNCWCRFSTIHGSAPTGASGTGPITLQGYPGETVNIKNTTNAAISSLDRSGGSAHGVYINICGLHIEGDGPAGVVNLQIKADNWRVVNNELTAPTAGAASAGGVTGNGTNIFVFGNEAHNISGSTLQNHGLYIDGDGSYEVAYNHIHDITGGSGLQAYNDGTNGSSITNNVSWHHNRVHNCAKYGINIADASGAGFKVWNNLSYLNTLYGLRANCTPTLVGAQVWNNTFYGNCSAGGGSNCEFINESTELPSSAITLKDNIFFTRTGTNYLGGTFSSGSQIFDYNLFYNSAQNVSADVHKVTSNPLFTNAASGDFTLQAASPAINAGTDTSSLVTDDFTAAVTRPQGVQIDMGACEWHA